MSRRYRTPQKTLPIAAGFLERRYSLVTAAKTVYCSGFLSHRYRTPQKTLPIAAVTKNAAIDLMYSGGRKTRRNRRHIAAVFAPAATACFSCSEWQPQNSCTRILEQLKYYFSQSSSLEI